MLSASQLTLTLLMPRIGANYAHHALPAYGLAVAAHLFYRCLYFHGPLLLRLMRVAPAPGLLRAENDPRSCQIIRRQLYRHLVARQNADIVHAHLARDMSQHYVAIFQLYPEGRVREVLHDLALHFDYVFF